MGKDAERVAIDRAGDEFIPAWRRATGGDTSRLAGTGPHYVICGRGSKSLVEEGGEGPHEPGNAAPEQAQPVLVRPYHRCRPSMHRRLVLPDGGRPDGFHIHK